MVIRLGVAASEGRVRRLVTVNIYKPSVHALCRVPALFFHVALMVTKRCRKGKDDYTMKRVFKMKFSSGLLQMTKLILRNGPLVQVMQLLLRHDPTEACHV